MIIHDGDVSLNLFINGEAYQNISFEKLELLLSSYKSDVKDSLDSKEIRDIENSYVCFSDDNLNHKFFCKIYKTCTGLDVWILLLMDDKEGYALYRNPVTNKMELAWYRYDLTEPLSEENERESITCYVPKIMN